MNDVRNFVRDTWHEYSEGKISFFMASTVTETAFGVLRCADNEFANTSMFDSTEWHMVVDYLGPTLFTTGSAIWLCTKSCSGITEPIVSDSSMNLLDLLCTLAMQCLDSFPTTLWCIAKALDTQEIPQSIDRDDQPAQLTSLEMLCGKPFLIFTILPIQQQAGTCSLMTS